MQKNYCILIFMCCCCSFLELLEARSPISVNRFGDITVSNDGTTIRCDRLNCPMGTYRCQVTKMKQDINSNFVERRSVCYSSTNQVLRENTIREPSAPGTNEELNISVMSDGTITSSGASSMQGGQGGYGYGYGGGSVMGANNFGGAEGSYGSPMFTGQISTGYGAGVGTGGYGGASGMNAGSGGFGYGSTGNGYGYGYNSGAVGNRGSGNGSSGGIANTASRSQIRSVN